MSNISVFSRLFYPKKVVRERLRHSTAVTGKNFVEATGKWTNFAFETCLKLETSNFSLFSAASGLYESSFSL